MKLSLDLMMSNFLLLVVKNLNYQLYQTYVPYTLIKNEETGKAEDVYAYLY